MAIDYSIKILMVKNNNRSDILHMCMFNLGIETDFETMQKLYTDDFKTTTTSPLCGIPINIHEYSVVKVFLNNDLSICTIVYDIFRKNRICKRCFRALMKLFNDPSIEHVTIFTKKRTFTCTKSELEHEFQLINPQIVTGSTTLSKNKQVLAIFGNDKIIGSSIGEVEIILRRRYALATIFKAIHEKEIEFYKIAPLKVGTEFKLEII